MSTALAKVLDEAADLLERDGWCQSVLCDRDGRRCARGAIIDAAPFRTLRWEDAEEWLSRQVRFTLIPAWNDALDRTAEEVIAAFRAAAETARATP